MCFQSIRAKTVENPNLYCGREKILRQQKINKKSVNGNNSTYSKLKEDLKNIEIKGKKNRYRQQTRK